MLKKLVLLFSFLLVVSMLTACGDLDTADADGKDSGSEGENAEQDGEKEEKEKKYGLGDTAEVGDVKITITNVSTTDERNEFEEDDPNIVVKVEYELENNTDEEIPVGADLQAYDGTGNQVESYPLENTMGSLKPGKKIQGVEHYGIEEGPIEVYFQPMFSLDEEAIFELEVE